MKWKRWAKSALMIVGLAVLITACGNTNTASDTNASNNVTEITFWHSMGGTTGKALDQLVQEYNDSHNTIQVNAQYQGEYDDALTKIRSAASGSKLGADVVQVFEQGTTFMKDSGLALPIQEYVDKDDFNVEQLEPNLAAYYTINDQLYSMPFNSSTPLMYYNKTLFDKAGVDVPESMEELAEIAPNLKEAGAEMPAAVAVYGWYIEQWMAKMQKPLYDNENGRAGQASKVTFDDNGGMKEILDMWLKNEEAGVMPNVGRDGGAPEFTSGKAAITVESTADLRQILDEVGDRFEVGTAYYPKVTSDDEGGVSIGGASLWMINSGDQEKMDATWDFIKFLVSPEAQATWNATTGYFPVVTTAKDEEIFQDNIQKYPQFQTAIDQLHDARPEDQGALTGTNQENRQVMEAELEKVLNKQESIEEAVQSMAKQINQSLSNYHPIDEQ